MINNLDNVIDSRDVIDAISELENEENLSEADEVLLQELKLLASECENYCDWEHGETLIRYSHWVDYVQEMLEDCGSVPRDMPWYIAVDWETTANNISHDYHQVDFGDVTYYIRCV